MSKRAAITPEQRESVRASQRVANMTPEQHEALKKRSQEYDRRRLANMTPEQRVRYRETQREYTRKWYANMTSAQREAQRNRNRARNRARKALLRNDPIILDYLTENRRERRRRRWASLSPEQRSAAAKSKRDWRANMSKEQRERFLERDRERKRAAKERKAG